MVEHGNRRPGALLLSQPEGPQVPGRRGGRLRDGGRHPGRGGQRGQPRPVQVEDLGHVRPDVVGAGITGHAQHRAHRQLAQAAQFLLQQHPVPVPAGQGDPRPRPGLLQDRGQLRGREVGPVLVLADQDRVTDRGQDARYRGVRRRRIRLGAEVGQDHRHCLQRYRRHRIGPGHGDREHTRVRADLTAAVRPDSAARAHHHALRAPRVRGRVTQTEVGGQRPARCPGPAS